MDRTKLLELLLDSLKDAFVFCDTEHVIRYINRTAAVKYAKDGIALGDSIFACHNEESNRVIREVFTAFEKGEDERQITDDEKHRVYMRAVRDEAGALLGYYERYEPPRGGRTEEER